MGPIRQIERESERQWLRAGLLGFGERWAAWGVEAGPRGGVLGRPKKSLGGRVGLLGWAENVFPIFLISISSSFSNSTQTI